MAELKNLLAAINAVMGEVGYVQKAQKNSFHNYRYAGEGDLLERLRPAMVEHGLVLIPSFDGDAPRIDEHGNTHIVMSYTLAHTSGEVWPTPIRVPGCGGDKNSKGGVGDKGTYKAITGANKYLLFKLFQIETGDDPEKDEQHNGNGHHADPAPAPAAKPKDKTPEDFAAAVLNATSMAKLDKLDRWLDENGDKAFGKQRADSLKKLILDKVPTLRAPDPLSELDDIDGLPPGGPVA